MSHETALQKAEESPEKSTDTIIEVPISRPFEGYTYIKKEWVDCQDEIDSVSINYTFGHVNLPANWDKLQTHVMMPQWGTTPLKRNWVVRLPTHLENQNKYLFHYYFQIHYQDNREKISDMFTELIIPKQVEYIDHSGAYSHIRLHWSIGGWLYPQDTELEVEGIEWGSDFSVSQSTYRAGDRLYELGRSALINKIPAPRVYRATIWGPKGATVNYCFNLITVEINGKLKHKWNNNNGINFEMTF